METQNETVTEPQGTEALSVEQAASKFLGIMDNQEASQDQPQEETQVPEEQASAEEPEQEDNQLESEETPEEEEAEPTYLVKAEGEEHEVTLEDLKKNYQLEANVRKKMETLAHEKKEIEGIKTDLQSKQQEYEQVAKTRQDCDQRLQMIEKFLEGQKEDLSSLKESDPVAYATKMVEQQEREKQQAQVQQERVRLAQEQQLHNQKLLQDRLVVEKKELERRIPDMADKEKGKVLQQEMREHALELGITEPELNNLLDSRLAHVLYNSTQYAKIMKSKPEVLKKVKKAPKMLKAGVAQPKNMQSERTRKLKQRAKQTGKIKDVAAVLEAII